jgi:hypothetical protein
VLRNICGLLTFQNADHIKIYGQGICHSIDFLSMQ